MDRREERKIVKEYIQNQIRKTWNMIHEIERVGGFQPRFLIAATSGC